MTSHPHEQKRGDHSTANVADLPLRVSLARLINSFLESEITSFQFDDQLSPFGATHDPVIRHVVGKLWYFYDDTEDHLVRFNKQEWDYIQRLLLILQSNCRIDTQQKREWSIKQLIALVSLCGYFYFAMQAGWWDSVFVHSIPFGLISMAIAFWPQRKISSLDPYLPLIYPFATFSDLANAYHSTSFRKNVPRSIWNPASRVIPA